MQEVFEKILNTLKNKSYERCGNDGMGGELVVNLDDAVEIVKQAAAEYNNGWIPCSSGKMPNEFEDVLIDIGGVKPIPAFIHKKEWYLTDCMGSGVKVENKLSVKAWRKLPELPEPYQQKGE